MERGSTLSVVLDTNVLVSAFVFGGKPQQLFQLVLQRRLTGIISPLILSELAEVLLEKFKFEEAKVMLLGKKIRKYFRLVHPTKRVRIVRDEPDNRILEAALQGHCHFVITGDKELLNLRKYKGIPLVTPAQFLQKIYPFRTAS